MRRLLDWLFPSRVERRRMNESLSKAHVQILLLKRAVRDLQDACSRNMDVYADYCERDTGHMILMGRDGRGATVVMIRHLPRVQFEDALRYMRRFAGPARLGGFDGPPGTERIANKWWADNNRLGIDECREAEGLSLPGPVSPNGEKEAPDAHA